MSTVHGFSNRSYTQQFPHTPNKTILNTIRHITIHHSCSSYLSNQSDYCNLHGFSNRLFTVSQIESIRLIYPLFTVPQFDNYPTITPSYTHTPNNTIRYLLSTTQALNNQINLHCNPPLFTVPQIDHIPNNYPHTHEHNQTIILYISHNHIVMSTLHNSSNRSYTQQLTLIHPIPHLSTQSDTYYPPLKHLISHESIRLIVIHMSTVHDFSNRSYTLQFPLEEIKAFQHNQTYYDPPHMLPNSLNTIRYLLFTTQAPHISRINQTHCNPYVHSSQFLKSIIYPTITPSYTQHPTIQHNQISIIHHSSTSYLTNESDSL